MIYNSLILKITFYIKIHSLHYSANAIINPKNLNVRYRPVNSFLLTWSRKKEINRSSIYVGELDDIMESRRCCGDSARQRKYMEVALRYGL